MSKRQTIPRRMACGSASGRFVLRLEPGLHAALRTAAREQGLSLNDHCARTLASPAGAFSGLRDAAAAVGRAAQLFGSELVGVLVFGSWARGELSDRSDVDLLIVVEPTVPLTRELYRRWDDAPIRWGSRPVEPHVVHLPPPDRTVGGLWAEAAIDGLVLFERGVRLSARLVQVRHDVVAGRLVRRMAHGQPYWAEVV